ncbi:MAG TPA: hypothetical protein VEZ90_10780 [Blastocatellia bacterium]|nr:hypothetical protein [Blastocatellia bacterium]
MANFLKWKSSIIKKMRSLTEREIVAKVKAKLNFPPLRTVDVQAEPDLGPTANKRLRPDLAVTLAWRGIERRFLAEVRSLATPKTLAGAIYQARQYAKAAGDERYPLVLAPFLSPEALDRLEEEDVSGIDLCGNGIVSTSGWLIYRTGAPNIYPMSAPIKNVFRGTSSLVARVFLMRETYSSVNDVYEEIKQRGGEITLPTVSKALKALQEELLIGRDMRELTKQAMLQAARGYPPGQTPDRERGTPQKGRAPDTGIVLLDSGRLLEAIERNYRRPTARRRLRGRFGTDRRLALATIASNADERNIRVVADDPTRYIPISASGNPMVIYTTSVETAMRGLSFSEDDRFPDFEWVETDEPSIYFDRRRDEEFYWTSPLETYLILRSGGKREKELAEPMGDGIKGLRYYK